MDKTKYYFESNKGSPYKNVRNTVNEVVWILKSGAVWRDLPTRYGTWNALYKCF
ncbi:MAG: transposase [Selenomonadaceae bacterium]|nr:transposase [Selenomonadaceae bacterium]